MRKSKLEELKEVLEYDPDSGVFTWIKTTSSRSQAGKIAGCISSDGYRYIKVNRTQYKASRLAFLFMTGSYPLIADHINRIRHDDRWCNLREADFAQNSQNKNVSLKNTSGANGVYWNKPRKKWYARCRINGVKTHLGSFDDLELAELVASEARAKYHGEFAV